VNGNFIETLVLKIYNRWGELIFESNNKNNGWDGTYKNKIADVGVYGYFLEAICFDGKSFFKKGNITLVR
jgi:gliding motility-associated-like protein